MTKSSLFFLLPFTTTTTSSPLQQQQLRYTFTPEACTAGYFPTSESSNITSGATSKSGLIIVDNRTIHCAPSLGVSRSSSSSSSSSTSMFGAAGIVSEGSMGDIAIFLPESNGIAIELWLKPAAEVASEQLMPIFTIGQKSNLVVDQRLPNASWNNAEALSVCDKGGFDFQLAVVNRNWTTTFRSADPVFEPCRTIVFGAVTPDKIAHVVISLSNLQQVGYLNGRPGLIVSHDPFDLHDWNFNDYGLHLLGYQRPFSEDTVALNSTSAILYQLALHSSPLSQADVVALLLQGLPSTPPYAYDQTVIVNEDAETIPGSHSTAWYRTAASPADAAPLVGPIVGSVDREVQELITESMIDTNNSTALTVCQPVYVYITDLPSQGFLYLADGTTSLSAEAIPILTGSAPVHNLIYMPPWNANSVSENDTFTSFRYCISKTVIFAVTQCESSATVNVHVTPVNDPPVALAVAVPVVLTEGIFANNVETTVKIPLRGSDVDTGDSIQQVQITKPPARGDLILAVTFFRQDFLPHGTHLSDLNYTIPGNDPVYVEYIWKPEAQGSQVIQGKGITDSLSFRVRDELGLWSLEEMVQIQIVSAVSALGNDTETFDQDSRDSINWRGMDDSGYNRRLGFFVEQIPSPGVGKLFDQAINKTLEAGTTLNFFDSFPYNNGVQVPFQPATNFCHDSEAQLDYDAEIRFRVVAYVNDTVVSASDSFSQNLTVACVLHVIFMTVPGTLISILETSLNRATSDPCYGALFDGMAPGQRCEAAAIINGIEVTSVDRDADRVFVSVSTKSGFLTFNKLYWNRTEPVVGRRVLASGAVSFYAYPEDLSNILFALHFESYVLGTDSIDFQLEYGNCSKLEVGLFPNSSTTSTCQVIRKSIAVEVVRDNKKYYSKTRIAVGFPWPVFLCLIAFPVLYVAVIYLESSCAGDNDEQTVIEGTPIEPVERFIQHEDENGMFYYEDTFDGSVWWDLPPCEDFIRLEDIGRVSDKATKPRPSVWMCPHAPVAFDVLKLCRINLLTPSNAAPCYCENSALSLPATLSHGH